MKSLKVLGKRVKKFWAVCWHWKGRVGYYHVLDMAYYPYDKITLCGLNVPDPSEERVAVKRPSENERLQLGLLGDPRVWELCDHCYVELLDG